MRIAALFLLAGILASTTAFAQPAIDATDSSFDERFTATPGDTTQRYRFDIPARPLREALTTFSRQASLSIDLAELEPGTRSNAVSGMLTPQQALRILLEGTGHSALFKSEELVVITRAAPRTASAHSLDPVVVSANAARRAGYAARRSSSATKTDLALRDIPQSVTVLARDLIADQSMQSMADVVRYIPGIAMGQGEGHRDAPTIRGNSSTADFFVDGVRDDAQYLRDLYNVERVEALKGSNALIFGRGGGGGVINRVSKSAAWTPARALTFEGGSFDHKRATLDLGDALTSNMAGRVNGMLERSHRFRDGTRLERAGVNPTLSILAGGTLLQAGYEYFADRRTVDRGIPSFDGRPSDADITTFFGDPAASNSHVYVHAADAAIEHRWENGVALRNRARYASYDKYYQNVFPGALDASGAQVSLSAYNSGADRRNIFNQTDLSAGFGSGLVRQTWLVGAEVGRQRTDNVRLTGFFNDQTTTLAVPFTNPTTTTPVTFRPSATDADNRVDADIAALYVQSQLSVGSRWMALLGVRYDWFSLDFQNHRNGQQLSRDDRMLSPRAGLVFKPSEPLSTYASYSVSHLPSAGDQFGSLTATTKTLEPERFTNREVGVKWDVLPDLSLSAAVYRVDRTNTSAPHPTDPARVVQTGRQRTTGVEASLSGNVTSRWQVAGGYALQRAKILSPTLSAPEGATVPLVPRHTLSLWNRFQLTSRLGTGLGMVRASDMYAAIDNAVTLPAFTRVDGALFVTLTRSVRAQLNVENLFDERYYATAHGNNNIMPGAPRSLRVTLTATP